MFNNLTIYIQVDILNELLGNQKDVIRLNSAITNTKNRERFLITFSYFKFAECNSIKQVEYFNQRKVKITSIIIEDKEFELYLREYTENFTNVKKLSLDIIEAVDYIVDNTNELKK